MLFLYALWITLAAVQTIWPGNKFGTLQNNSQQTNVVTESGVQATSGYGSFTANFPQSAPQFTLNGDGTALQFCDMTIDTNEKMTGFAYNTYDISTHAIKQNGKYIELDPKLFENYQFIQATDSTKNNICAIQLQTKDLTQKKQTFKYLLYDITKGTKVDPDLETVEEMSNQNYIESYNLALLQSAENPYLFVWDRGQERKLSIFKKNDKDWKFNAVLNNDEMGNSMIQHPSNKKLCMLYNYAQSNNSYGYKFFDLESNLIHNGATGKGNFEHLSCIDSDSKILVADNHYDNGPSTDSFIKIFDIETHKELDTFGSKTNNTCPEKRIIALTADANYVIALSYDGYIYVFVRNTGELLEKIYPFKTSSPRAFENDGAVGQDTGEYLNGQMRISNNLLLAILNTGYNVTIDLRK